MGGLFIPERPDVLQRVYDLRALSPWALACTANLQVPQVLFSSVRAA